MRSASTTQIFKVDMDRITTLEARVTALEQACAQAAASVARATQAMSVADVLMRSAGYRPPEPDADPEPTVTPQGPRPLSPSTVSRPVCLTHLPDGRAILEVGDSRIDFSEREIEVLTWMLAPKVPKVPVTDWRT